MDLFNSVMESTEKISYTNTEFKDCIISNKNYDKKNIFLSNKQTDQSYFNFSKIEDKNQIYIINDEVK